MEHPRLPPGAPAYPLKQVSPLKGDRNFWEHLDGDLDQCKADNKERWILRYTAPWKPEKPGLDF